MVDSVYNVFKDSIGNHLASKVKKICQFFYGKPYIPHPIPKGFLSDDFYYSFEDFDNLTFVETVIALLSLKEVCSECEFLPAFNEKLINVRYKNHHTNFLNRNHFVETEWLEHNLHFFHEIDFNIPQTKAKIVINKYNYLKKHELSHMDNLDQVLKASNLEIEDQHAEIEYISKSKILTNFNFLDNKDCFPAFIMFIKENWDIETLIGTRLLISHIGIVLKRSKNKYNLFHAGTKHKPQVKCDDLYQYIKDANISGIKLMQLKI